MENILLCGNHADGASWRVGNISQKNVNTCLLTAQSSRKNLYTLRLSSELASGPSPTAVVCLWR